jgi:phosphatidylinositol-3-phosphatase
MITLPGWTRGRTAPTAGRRPAPAAARAASLAVAAAAAIGIAGCAAGPGTVSPGPPASSAPASTPAPGSRTAAPGSGAATALPRPAHVVVVVEENKDYSGVVGSHSAPYINALAARGALFTHASAVAHPSEPNYLAIFSGSTKGITDDSCPHTFGGPNLASEAIAAHLTFAGYAESMPRTGYAGCDAGEYARKHNPWSDFSNVPAAGNRPFASFPRDYASLPAISFVIPNLNDDMHDGTVSQGDSWLREHLNGYAQWAASHNSLLVLTWDEDDGGAGNHIATVITGAHVKPGRYGESISHYNVLRTIEDLYRLPHLGASASVPPLTSIF